MAAPAPLPPLAGFRVIDLADESGIFAARLLADLGADVIRVEPPGGDRVRSLAPFLDGIAGPERGYQHLAYNAGKRSVVLDVGSPRGQAAFRRLIAGADALIDTSTAEQWQALGISDEDLRRLNPRLVRASITPFGRASQWASRRGSDLIAAAAGGLLHVSGDPDVPPVLAGGNQSFKLASMAACTGVLAALRGRSGAATLPGLHVDISIQECVNFATLQTSGPAFWRWWQYVPPRRTGHEFPVVRCRDGRYAVARARADRWAELRDWALARGLTVSAGSDQWQEATKTALGSFRLGESADLVEALAPMYDRDDFLERCYALGLVALPVQTFGEMSASEHLKAIGEFVRVEHTALGVNLEAPKSPFAGLRGVGPVRRAPLLGEHTESVVDAPSPSPTPVGASKGLGPVGPPLAGLRVLELALVLAGPLSGRIFANLGAEVIKVESSARMDMRGAVPPPSGPTLTAGGWFNDANTGKLSATINTRSRAGKELLLRLAARCDIVLNNLRPGAIERMGLPYAELSAVNPGVIVVHMPGAGRTGPWSGLATFGNHINAAAGLNTVTGFPGTAPAGLGIAYADFVSPYLAASAAIAAVIERRRTGGGQEIDMAQLPGLVSLLSAEWMEYARTGVEPARRANRDPNFAPHGVYPARGDDRWLAIAVDGDATWRRFAAAIGQPDLADDELFRTHSLRKTNEDRLDRVVSSWSRGQDRWAAADLLQSHGVTAAAVEDLADNLDLDPCLSARFEVVEQPSDPGLPITVHGEQIRIVGLERPILRAPAMGEHNEYVLREVVGLADEELVALVEAGVIE